MVKTGFLAVLWLVLAAVCVSCDRNRPAATEGVLAIVNGTPITETDVLFASRGAAGHQTKEPSVDKQTVLDNLILQELTRQRAVEVGLDTDAAYQEELRLMETQINAFKRKKLSELFLQREIMQKAKVDDAEARQYFEDNAARLRTEIHVFQILRRNQGEIEKIRDELAQGISLEEIAARQFANLPNRDRKPWDLGYLRWHQVPEAWQNVVYGLDIGATSDIIRGPNNRFWIIKLIDKRENADITFEQIKPIISNVVKNEKARRLRGETLRDLREHATIVYSKQE